MEIRVFKDGNMWCALWGNNLQEGVVGFSRFLNGVFDEFLKDFLSKFYTLEEHFTPKEIVEMCDNLEETFDDSFGVFFKEVLGGEKEDWDKSQAHYYKLKVKEDK